MPLRNETSTLENWFIGPLETTLQFMKLHLFLEHQIVSPCSVVEKKNKR